MLIIEIALGAALGIVLGFVLLANLPTILAFLRDTITVSVIVAALAGFVWWATTEPDTAGWIVSLALVFMLFVTGAAIWKERQSRRKRRDDYLKSRERALKSGNAIAEAWPPEPPEWWYTRR